MDPKMRNKRKSVISINHARTATISRFVLKHSLCHNFITCFKIFKLNPPKLTANLNNGLLFFAESQRGGK
jgi:Zn-dependent peptidase ImmA (M78 family)